MASAPSADRGDWSSLKCIPSALSSCNTNTRHSCTSKSRLTKTTSRSGPLCSPSLMFHFVLGALCTAPSFLLLVAKSTNNELPGACSSTACHCCPQLRAHFMFYARRWAYVQSSSSAPRHKGRRDAQKSDNAVLQIGPGLALASA
jgi:hypothetical protein